MTILIAGGGKMGMSHLALTTQYVGKTNVALCDTNFFTRFLFQALGYRTFSSVELAAKSLDHINGLLIATPTRSHAALARWAIAQKIPFFVEKPLTLDFSSSNELKIKSECAGVPAQVGFVMRYVPSFQRLRQLVSGGILGLPLSYIASMHGNVITKSPHPESWQADFSRGGGCLNEYGPHIIDLCNFIFGPVLSVNNASMEQVFCSRADDRLSMDWTHENSTIGHLDIDWCDCTKRKSIIEFHVLFEYGEVRVDNSAVELKLHPDAPITTEMRFLIDSPIQPPNVGFYLRGEEFSLELEVFLGMCTGQNLHVDNLTFHEATPRLHDGCEVDRLIEEIALKAGLK